MTDEQRMREQFDAFVYRQTVNRDKSGPWPTPTELAWLAWLARDAEVQALRERNDRMAHELFVLGVDIDAPNDEEGGAE